MRLFQHLEEGVCCLTGEGVRIVDDDDTSGRFIWLQVGGRLEVARGLNADRTSASR